MFEETNIHLLHENNKFTSNLTIGVSGYARVGKNSLCDLLKKQAEIYSLKAKIFSFAFSLKSDLDLFCKKSFGISSFCETEEKNTIRPLLIAYGECQRKVSKGTYWWEKIMQEVNSFYNSGGEVAIISDLRFKEYNFDELDYVRSYANSIVFSVGRILENGEKIGPAHKTEEINIPIIAKSSDLTLDWKTVDERGETLALQACEATSLCSKFFKKINNNKLCAKQI